MGQQWFQLALGVLAPVDALLLVLRRRAKRQKVQAVLTVAQFMVPGVMLLVVVLWVIGPSE